MSERKQILVTVDTDLTDGQINAGGATLYLCEGGDNNLDHKAISVEVVTKSGVSDGLVFDENGYLYLSALEENAINRLTPEGELERAMDAPLPDHARADENASL